MAGKYDVIELLFDDEFGLSGREISKGECFGQPQTGNVTAI